MTRKYWKLDGCKAAEADYVLAVIDGIVDSVFEPDEWFKTETGTYRTLGVHRKASQRIPLYREKREVLLRQKRQPCQIHQLLKI